MVPLKPETEHASGKEKLEQDRKKGLIITTSVMY